MTTAAPIEEGSTVADKPSYYGTRLHATRVPDPVWEAAIARANEPGEQSVTAVIVAALTAYGKGERFVLPARGSKR